MWIFSDSQSILRQVSLIYFVEKINQIKSNKYLCGVSFLLILGFEHLVISMHACVLASYNALAWIFVGVRVGDLQIPGVGLNYLATLAGPFIC